MKRIQYLFCAATVIGGMLSVASCSSEDEVTTTGKQVPLEIQVSGVQTTRSIIKGSKFVDDCQYGIFAMQGGGTTVIDNGVNVCVNYSKGTSTLSTNVYLPEGVDVPVYAYYPYNANYSNTDYLLQMPIDATTQTDYLYGYSADSDNRLTYIKAEQPKANIYFKHAMARVTMRIKKAADNEKMYKFPYISLLNVDKSGYINLKDGGAISHISGTTNLTVKPSNYGIDDAESEIVADFLVIPGNTEGKNIILNMNDVSGFESGLSATVPVTEWQAGQQYTYTVTIRNGSLAVSQAEITPWENSEQEGLNVGDDNYIDSRAYIGDIYYSDGTTSKEFNQAKTPIGVVFALSDQKGGDVSRTLTRSIHGRIVALKDLGEYNFATTAEYLGAEGLFFDEGGDWYGDLSFNEVMEIMKVNSYGIIESWPESGMCNDFDGLSRTQLMNNENYPAAYACCRYSTEGTQTGNWYLPSLGEAELLRVLFKTNFICNEKQSCFNDWTYDATMEYPANNEYYWISNVSKHSGGVTCWSILFHQDDHRGNGAGSGSQGKYSVRPVMMF